MKQINPIQTWVNGQSVTATIFNLYIVGGILGTSSTFYYSLADELGAKVAEGNIIMDGAAYASWGNDDEYAWEWAATTLNLTIIGNYVPPVPPTPIEENLTEETQIEE